MRLMQALVASSARLPPGDREDARAVLRAVEALPPPTMHAPRPRPALPIRSAVPNNDGDIAWRPLRTKRGSAGERAARVSAAKLQTLRQRTGHLLSAGARYVWDADLPPSDAAMLARIAHAVTHVGQGTDLAGVRYGADDTKPPNCVTYTPDNASPNTFSIPYPGALVDLDERHEHELGRLSADGVAGAMAHPKGRRLHGYAASDTPPRNAFAAFRLLGGQSTHAIGPERGLELAAMLRHAIHQTALRAGFSKEDVSAIMGHAAGGRIHAVPVPNVAHHWADGHMRRVMLIGPPDVRDSIWGALTRRIAAATLVPDHQPEGDPLLLEPLAGAAIEGDRVLQRFVAPSRLWTSATPAVLPGADHGRKGRPRPAKAIRRMLRFAGVDTDCVAWGDLHLAGIPTGTRHARDYVVPAHLAKYPRTHLTIEFHEPTCGPLLLGAGVGWGLGLLVSHSAQASDPAGAARRAVGVEEQAE